jgi:hypothetical protein
MRQDVALDRPAMRLMRHRFVPVAKKHGELMGIRRRLLYPPAPRGLLGWAFRQRNFMKTSRGE